MPNSNAGVAISDKLTNNGDIDPYQTEPDANGNPVLVGQPSPDSGLGGRPGWAIYTVLSHYDNIHNHHVEAK